jgi:hypothetical protein
VKEDLLGILAGHPMRIGAVKEPSRIQVKIGGSLRNYYVKVRS